MTDETRDEIVRLARKGLSVEDVYVRMRGAASIVQVQQVIDEAEAMSGEHDVPQWDCVDADDRQDK